MTIKEKKKPIIYGYIRVSTTDQDIRNQKHEIDEYCRKHGLDLNLVQHRELTISSRKSVSERFHHELLDLEEGDILIATEISRLGRSTSEVLQLVNQLLTNKVRVIFTKQNLDLNISHKQDMVSKIILTIFSMMAELERDIISLRTKEALASKMKQPGFSIGRPKGATNISIYNDKEEDIKDLFVNKKVSINAISRILGFGKPLSLRRFLEKKNLLSKRKAS